MRSIIQVADDAGTIRVGDANHGFLLSPAFERGKLGSSVLVHGQPGDFPVTVKPLSSGETLEVHGRVGMKTDTVFGGFTITNADPGSCWHILLLTDPSERFEPGGAPGRVMGLVKGGEDVPFGDPTPLNGLRVPVRACFTSVRVHGAVASGAALAVGLFDEYDNQLGYWEIDPAVKAYLDVPCDGTRGYLSISNPAAIGTGTMMMAHATIGAY